MKDIVNIHFDYIMSLQMFYKKNNERNATKLEKIERDGSACKRTKGKGKAASKPKVINKEPGTIIYCLLFIIDM